MATDLRMHGSVRDLRPRLELFDSVGEASSVRGLAQTEVRLKAAREVILVRLTYVMSTVSFRLLLSLLPAADGGRAAVTQVLAQSGRGSPRWTSVRTASRASQQSSVRTAPEIGGTRPRPAARNRHARRWMRLMCGAKFGHGGAVTAGVSMPAEKHVLELLGAPPSGHWTPMAGLSTRAYSSTMCQWSWPRRTRRTMRR